MTKDDLKLLSYLVVIPASIIGAILILSKLDIPQYKTVVMINHNFMEVKEAHFEGNHLFATNLNDIKEELLILSDHVSIIKTPIQSK